MPKYARDEMVISYYRVRQALGLLGLSLPVTLVLSGLLTQNRIEPSISDFFHTLQRDIFVGTITTIAVFLIVYQGPERRHGDRYSDSWITSVAGIAALCVAFFPNETGPGTVRTLSQHLIGHRGAAIVHYLGAIMFLGSLAYISLVRFPRSLDRRKRRAYRICGWLILASMVATIFFSVLKQAGFDWVVRHRVVFWVEVIGVWAFSLSWLIKGDSAYQFARQSFAGLSDPSEMHHGEVGGD